MEIDLTTLPITLQRQIPLSIRTYQNTYDISDLPVTVQTLIKSYLQNIPDISYDKGYDLVPQVSEYSDFKTISNLDDLAVEYLKNYLMVLPEAYPFDPEFGCRLKYQLQTRDTSLRQTIISSEIDNIAKAISSQLSVQMQIESIKVIPTSVGTYNEYNCYITLKINGNRKQLIMEFT